jgi:hypothetical protein
MSSFSPFAAFSPLGHTCSAYKSHMRLKYGNPENPEKPENTHRTRRPVPSGSWFWRVWVDGTPFDQSSGLVPDGFVWFLVGCWWGLFPLEMLVRTWIGACQGIIRDMMMIDDLRMLLQSYRMCVGGTQ